jgi:hypothetical protein
VSAVSRGRRAGLALALAAALLAVASAPAPAQRFVAGPDPAFPRLKYGDSLVSANDRCMVRGSKLNPRVRPLYVNGRPVGFC